MQYWTGMVNRRRSTKGGRLLYAGVPMRLLSGTLCVFLVLGMGAISFAAPGDDLKDLQKQLAVAEQPENADNAAIAEICRRIVEIDPANHEAWEKRVRALLALNDLPQMKKALDEWDQPGHGITAASIDLTGDLANAQKNYDSALSHWMDYVKRQPRAIDTWKKIDQLQELQKRWDKAAEALSKVISIEDSAESRVARARCSIKLRKWDDARADFKKANALDATNEELKTELPKFEQLDKALPKIKDLDRKIAAAKPPQANLVLDRGLVFHGAGLDDLALEEAEAALAVAPKSRRAVLQKAQAITAAVPSKEQTEELAKLRIIIKNNKFSETALQKIGALDAQIEAKPDDAALLTSRARECSDIEQYGLAEDDALAAAKLDPQSADALVELAFAAMKLGDTPRAKADFVLATHLDPKNAVAWRSLGELAMDRADYPAAIEDFSRSLELHESPLVLQKREQCYRNSGHAKEADEDLQRWQKLAPPKK